MRHLTYDGLPSATQTGESLSQSAAYTRLAMGKNKSIVLLLEMALLSTARLLFHSLWKVQRLTIILLFQDTLLGISSDYDILGRELIF